jgi:hypothetical protein
MLSDYTVVAPPFINTSVQSMKLNGKANNSNHELFGTLLPMNQLNQSPLKHQQTA